MGGRIARRQDAPMHRWRQGVCGFQITISLTFDGKTRSDAKRDECCFFHPPARTRGVIGPMIICIMWVKIKNMVCNKIIEIIVCRWASRYWQPARRTREAKWYAIKDEYIRLILEESYTNFLRKRQRLTKVIRNANIILHTYICTYTLKGEIK